MSTLIQYRSLLSVKVILDYFLPEETSLYAGLTATESEQLRESLSNQYRLQEELSIIPTPETTRNLHNLRMVFKPDHFGFQIATRVEDLNDGTFQPFLPLDEPFRLSFSVRMVSPDFLNYSTVPFSASAELPGHWIYYFSNEANNQVGDILNLSQVVPSHDSLAVYEAGRLAENGGVIFEAIQDNGPGPFAAADWQEVLPGVVPVPQFVTLQDRILLRSSIFQLNVASLAQEELEVLIRDRDGQLLQTIAYRSPETGTPLNSLELNLNELEPDLYTIELQDSIGTPFPEFEHRFYLDDQLFYQRPLALIDILHFPDGSLGAYRLLDEAADDRLLTPTYHIRWHNRSTWWRYHFREAPTFTSTDLEVYESSPGSPVPTVLVSSGGPFGLSKLSRRVEITEGGEIRLLPGPLPSNLFFENGRVYSEIYLGGGLLPPNP